MNATGFLLAILALLRTLTCTSQWQCDVCGGWFSYTCDACKAVTR